MHTKLHINEFMVEFPFEPYDCQIKFMEKILEALKTGQNAALESPTGTGKTLCLLCSAIAYLKDCKTKLTQPGIPGEITGTSSSSSRSIYPKVMYASRTHSQLAQVIRELNKTTYRDIKTVTMASRDLLCINDKVMKEGNSHVKSLMCRNLISKHQCLYYNQYEKADPADLDLLYNENGMVPDIEDVINISMKHRFCPYFRNRKIFEKADLILLPYNYIVDPCLRHKHNIELNGNIVIFDEAHNLESICEESTSVSFSTTQLSGCIREAKKVLEMLVNDEEEIRTKMDNTASPFGVEVQETKEIKIEKNDVAYLLASLHQLEEAVDEFKKDGKVSSGPEMDGKVYPGEKMIELLSKVGFRKDMREGIVLTIDKIGQYLTSKAENGSDGEQFVDRGAHLQEFSSFISTAYADAHASGALGNLPFWAKSRSTNGAQNGSARCYQLYVTENGSVITLNYWCFSPSVAMRYLYSCGVRSVIVTSGTLSPLDSFVNGLGIDVPIILENKHAAKMDQILGARIRCTEAGIGLLGTFQNRSTAEYVNGVAEVIVRACQIIPGGILVFFSSYTIMNSCLKLWKATKCGLTSMWDKLTTYKAPFVEPKSKVELKAVMLQFRQKINEGRGAVLFAVCRAKVSEGIDFSDDESRGVIVVGIPYAPTTNPRITLKKQFLTKQRVSGGEQNLKKCLSADDWYQVDAIRGVNQSIGRVLRHKDDFGVIILVDTRFCSMPAKRFPLWMRDSLKNYQDISCFENECEQFFNKRGITVQRAANRKKMSPAMKTTIDSASSRKRNEIAGADGKNRKSLLFDIDALYSSEAVAAFESSICIDDTVPKRPKRSCIFDEIEEDAKCRDNSALVYPIDDTNSIEYPTGSSMLVKKKAKSKLRLKPNNPTSMPYKPPNNGRSVVIDKNSEDQHALSRQNNEDEMSVWKKTAKDYHELLQATEESKRCVLKVALVNYAAKNDFQSLISTFRTEALPHHVELFKGLYGYLQVEHRPQFATICRQLKLL